MESRVLIAFILSLVILIGWQFIFPSPAPVKGEPTASVSAPLGSPVVEKTSSFTPPALVDKEDKAHAPQTVLLENDHVALTISTAQGGGVTRIVLKKFFETPQKETPYALFTTGKGGPLFKFSEEQSGCFRRSPQLKQISVTQAQLIYVCGNGKKTARVTYALDAAYTLNLEVGFSPAIDVLGKELWLSFPVEAGRKPHLSQYNTEQVVYAMGEKVERITVASEGLTSGQVKQSPVDWFSFGDRYFFVGALFPVQLKPIVTVSSENSQTAFLKFLFPKEKKEKEDSLVLSTQSYIGPKDRVLLKGMGTLDRVIDFGFFTILAVPIWYFLKFFYNHLLANFGVAIIILTILVRLLFFPLTMKGMGNMKAMQQLQPQIQKLKEKYAEDRQKLNQEMMLLMRAHKVNPLGGCLPILIQIPVFIALYAVLSNAVELYHAHFGLWIHDLSAKDPYYVLPVLLGISFLIQQKLTPSAVDPMTQKMMMIMPIVFTVFMVNLPSGLNLYIFTSTVLGIVQQVVMNRKTKSATVVM